MMKTKKSYNELLTLGTFEERFEYLKCPGKIGDDTFGYDRWVNQKFYTSPEWRNFRNKIIVRDDGCDMALENYKIPDGELIHVHHINPMSVEDILNRNPAIFDENNVVCVRELTHKAIHYGDLSSVGILKGLGAERYPDDMFPWRQIQKEGGTVVSKRVSKQKIRGVVKTMFCLNVRSTPEVDANNIIDMLADGTEVEILDDTNPDFYKIKMGQNKSGFVMKKFVIIKTTPTVDK